MAKKSRRPTKKQKTSPKPQPGREPRSHDAEIALRVAWKLLKLAVWATSVLVVLKLFAAAPDYSAIASALAGMLVFYDLFDAINWKRRKYFKARSLWPLLAAYVSCVVVMALIATTGFYAQNWWTGVIIVVVFILGGLARARTEALICTRLRKLHLDRGEPRWFSGFSIWLGRTIENFADRGSDGSQRFADLALERLATWLRAGIRGPFASARRLVALGTMIACLVLGTWSGIATGARLVTTIEGRGRVATATEPQTRQKHTTRDAATATARPPAGGAQSPSTAATSNSVDPSQCAVPPGTGAPSWASKDIFALYLGGAGPAASEAPGTQIAGCPEHYHLMNTRDGEFVYTIGEGAGGRPLSVAVDSSRGAALFLAPAVEPLLELIHQVGAVGGGRKFTVGAGQFLSVQTDRGTYLLSRRETGTELQAEPFVVIPPVVTQAWAAAITRSGHFLWPVPPSHRGDYIYRFQTSTTPPQTAYSFSYRPSNASEPELSEAELATLAAKPE
jgi:hypothetical protein